MYPWNFSNIFGAVAKRLETYAALPEHLAAQYPGASLSHARVRTSTLSAFANLVDNADTVAAEMVVLKHEGRSILWVKLKQPLASSGGIHLEWLEITEVRPGDRNEVDALVYQVPGLAGPAKHTGGPGFTYRFQASAVEDIISAAQEAA